MSAFDQYLHRLADEHMTGDGSDADADDYHERLSLIQAAADAANARHEATILVLKARVANLSADLEGALACVDLAEADLTEACCYVKAAASVVRSPDLVELAKIVDAIHERSREARDPRDEDDEAVDSMAEYLRNRGGA